LTEPIDTITNDKTDTHVTISNSITYLLHNLNHIESQCEKVLNKVNIFIIELIREREELCIFPLEITEIY
jgi:hypothetical protein